MKTTRWLPSVVNGQTVLFFTLLQKRRISRWYPLSLSLQKDKLDHQIAMVLRQRARVENARTISRI